MLTESNQLLIAGKSGAPLTFITGLKYETNVVKALNNLTFIYDPNWEYESMNPTYPIAFFYVVKQHETMTAEPSQKPMLFYNSEGEGSDTVKAGLLNVVADNIVIKPKTYKLDVLVPMNMDTFFDGGYFNLSNFATVNDFISGGTLTGAKSSLDSVLPVASAVVNASTQAMRILKTLFTALYGTEISASSLVTMLCNQQDYNKNSIEYMWRNRRIIKLKMWTGWNFKYLAITDFEVSKEGTNGAFFEGAITCQELPIITLKSSDETSKTFLSTISSALGDTMKSATEGFISAMEATVG